MLSILTRTFLSVGLALFFPLDPDDAEDADATADFEDGFEVADG